MPKLRPENPTEVIRKLRKLGFEGSFGGGKHLVMRHPQTRLDKDGEIAFVGNISRFF